ncbi:MAG: class I SAM-dependent methyltransferase [Chitinophagaceae bacterium]|nr:class I SAM-dependent methyltransferase [Chitinophagaceae bacterium]MBL0336058.1 class I SAM-dependent methyltransferase [Chitinophagaceae bacterium]
MIPDKKYIFEHNEYCEMCGDKTENHKILGQRLNQSQGFRPKKKTGITVSVKKCRNCGLLYSYPMPIPFSIQDHYGIDPEEYSWKEDYYVDDPDYYSTQINTVKKLLPEKSTGMKALDVGAGLGKALKAMQRAGFDVFGIEPSPNFRTRAIEWLKIPEDQIRLATAEEAVFPDNHFDFITYGAVYEHLYHPAAVLERSVKWLKPGGIIHIEVPNAENLVGKLINRYYRLRGTNYVTSLSPMHAPFHLYEYTVKSFEEVCKKLNLELVEKKFDVCSIFHFPGIMKPFMRKYMEWTNTGMQLTVYLRKPLN